MKKRMHKRRRVFKTGVLIVALLFLHVTVYSCKQDGNGAATSQNSLLHPEWSKNLSIYEVNLRQYTPEGTFKAFEAHLTRLKEMGIGILWFMPIHPIGKENRKGSLGSYYSVRDYLAVNPEHGTMNEFKALVKKIHGLGMYVLIDWVANHTAWDNSLATEHPEWYNKDEYGNFIPPVPDWTDVIDLDYDNLELRKYMINALKFWVEETDIDGFRCDVAGMVPTDFWNAARAELDKIKPVFMLAEWETPELHEKAFDMTYSWELYRVMNAIAKGEKHALSIDTLLTREANEYPRDAYRMRFTSNHDENSWNGTVFERLGDGAKAFAVLSVTVPGMPLVYSGQEAGLDKRLQFFDKDPIDWQEHEFAELYTILLNLKKENRALWHGAEGGKMTRLPTSNDEIIFAFLRESKNDKIIVILNLSGSEQKITLSGISSIGLCRDIFKNEMYDFKQNTDLSLKPWEYRVLVK